jgi:lipid A 3-O-deacylase
MRYRQLRAGGALAAGLVLAMAAPAAFAGDGWVDEVKLGVLKHDISLFGDSTESGLDVNGEVRFHAIDWFAGKDNPVWLNDLLSPRPDIGASINTSGNTDFYYFGLTWTWDFAHDVFQAKDGLYGDFGFGGAFHDGDLNNAPPGEKAFGSRALFHLSGEIGYRFDPRWSLSVYYDHYSNGGLADPNPGINDAGVRVGYRF